MTILPPPEEPEGNVYAPPRVEGGRWITLLPNWLVILFALGASMLPLSLIEHKFEGLVNGCLYGLPFWIAGVFFALNNLKASRHRTGSVVALIISGLVAISSIILILRWVA